MKELIATVILSAIVAVIIVSILELYVLLLT